MVRPGAPAGPSVNGPSADPSVNGNPPHPAPEGRFRPVRPLGQTTWLAEFNGEWVAARPLPSLVDGGPARPDVTGARLPRAPGPAGREHLIRFSGLALADGTPWAVSQYVPGAPLDRLMTVATLTARQATAIALEIYAALAALHTGGL